MIPPRGLASQENPLWHNFEYSFGLNAVTETLNSAWIPLVKNYKGVIDPATTFVNPHSDRMDLETGAICAPMSIIEKLKFTIKFDLLSSAGADQMRALKFWWQPFFASFPEKYDAADDDAGTTVAAIMQLTKDATQEDITPLTTNKLNVTGSSEKDHPLSTVNLAEAYDTHLNMTTNIEMEDTPFNSSAFYTLIKYGTNKGALKACLGQRRNINLQAGKNEYQGFHLNKFVPKAIRRIVPYTFFGILVHVPIVTDFEQAYTIDTALNAAAPHVGVKARVTYAEWNEEHNNTMADA